MDWLYMRVRTGRPRLYGDKYFVENWPLSPDERDMKKKLVQKVEMLHFRGKRQRSDGVVKDQGVS